VTRRFDSAVETQGLRITPHNLRDTAASLAIQEGASVVAVARLLGHESAATTLNHYAITTRVFFRRTLTTSLPVLTPD
jgi:integrase